MNTQTNNIRNIEIFITNDLGATPVYTQSAKLGTGANTEYTIDLTTPFKIEAGKPLYVGYKFKITDAPANNRLYYVPVDGVSSDAPACIYGYVGSSGKTVWENAAPEIGSLCMGCVVSGENLPQHGVTLSNFTISDGMEPGKAVSGTVTIMGFGIQPAKSVELAYSANGASAVSLPVTLSTPLTFGQRATVSLPSLTCADEVFNGEAVISVAKVNGEESSVVSSATASFTCFDRQKGFKRVHVIEEGTGTWCGWCPRGIVMMEAAAKNYPELFARVALHSDDEMSTSEGDVVLNGLNVPGFPCMYIDRTVETDPGYYISLFPQYAADKTTAAVAFDGLTAAAGTDGKIKITSTVKSALNIDNAADRLRVAYYVTEDGVGPYNQNNSYAGGTNGTCGGWERKSASPATMYDDVCRRYLGGFNGFANSLPAAIEAGKPCEHNASFSTASVDGEKYHVIALLINAQTGEIVNAAQIESNKDVADSAIDEIEAKEAVSVTCHDLSGRLVERPAAGSLYIRTTRYSDGTTRSVKFMQR